MELMNYSMYSPPLPESLYLNAMARKETRKIYNQFIDAIPFRLRELRRMFDSNCGKDIEFNFHTNSFHDIGKWLNHHTETRSKTDEETEFERSIYPSFVHDSLNDWVLTDETISLCTDIGIYFGETMRRNWNLNWELWTKGKRDVYYQHPVLVPFIKKMHFSPISSMKGIAARVVKGSNATKEMLETYQIWEQFTLKDSPAQ